MRLKTDFFLFEGRLGEEQIFVAIVYVIFMMGDLNAWLLLAS